MNKQESVKKLREFLDPKDNDCNPDLFKIHRVPGGNFSLEQLLEQINILSNTIVDSDDAIAKSLAYYTFVKSLENKGYGIFAIMIRDNRVKNLNVGTDIIGETYREETQ